MFTCSGGVVAGWLGVSRIMHYCSHGIITFKISLNANAPIISITVFKVVIRSYLSNKKALLFGI